MKNNGLVTDLQILHQQSTFNMCRGFDHSANTRRRLLFLER